MIGESGVGGRAGEAFFQVLGCFQARASTAFQTVGWGMSHDPANTWAVVTTPFSIDWCSTSRRWRLHSESSSKPYAVVCERHRARPRPRSAAARVSPPRPGRHASLAVLSGWGRPGAFQPLCQGGHASRQALGKIINNLVCGGSHPARVAHSPAAVGERMKHLWSLRLQVAVPGGAAAARPAPTARQASPRHT